jgi:hypothetical protein
MPASKPAFLSVPAPGRAASLAWVYSLSAHANEADDQDCAGSLSLDLERDRAQFACIAGQAFHMNISTLSAPLFREACAREWSRGCAGAWGARGP